jgi:hypothetical protein
LGESVYLPLQIETTLSQKGPTGQFESGSWFWHPWDHTVATKTQVLDWLAGARKLKANLVVNVGIMDSGKMRPEDEQLLFSLRR